MTQNKLLKDWEIVSISKIAKIETGTTPSKAVNEYYGNEYPFYKPSDLGAGINVFKSIDGLTKLGVDKARYVAENTTLVTCIGATIGKTGFLKKGGGFNQQINAIVPNEDTNPKFIYYQAIGLDFQKQIKDNASATTLPLLNKSKFQLLTMVTCPLETQHAIVSKIEELFSELDKGIEDLKTAQLQLKTYRQAVLKYAFEGKLTNNKVKDGVLPKGWEMLKTIDVIKIINNGYTPKSQFLSQGSGEIPFIKVYNLNFNGTLNFKKNPTFIPKANHEKDLKRSICIPGDVLINIVGPPLGKTSVVTDQFPEWNINQAIVMFRPNENVISKYISYYMQNTFTTNWLEGTSKATAGQWNVKVSTCREIPFPYCSVKEQYQIVQEIESRLSVADKMEESIVQSLLQAESLRQSILKKAFSGELV